MTARSVAMPLGMQEAPRSIPTSGRSSSRCFKKSSCQLMAKECALITGKLPLGGLPRNSVVRIIDCPDMTSAVDRGHKASTQPTMFDISVQVWLLSLFMLVDISVKVG